jgi:hypothetical protein
VDVGCRSLHDIETDLASEPVLRLAVVVARVPLQQDEPVVEADVGDMAANSTDLAVGEVVVPIVTPVERGTAGKAELLAASPSAGKDHGHPKQAQHDPQWPPHPHALSSNEQTHLPAGQRAARTRQNEPCSTHGVSILVNALSGYRRFLARHLPFSYSKSPGSNRQAHHRY